MKVFLSQRDLNTDEIENSPNKTMSNTKEKGKKYLNLT